MSKILRDSLVGLANYLTADTTREHELFLKEYNKQSEIHDKAVALSTVINNNPEMKKFAEGIGYNNLTEEQQIYIAPQLPALLKANKPQTAFAIDDKGETGRMFTYSVEDPTKVQKVTNFNIGGGVPLFDTNKDQNYTFAEGELSADELKEFQLEYERFQKRLGNTLSIEGKKYDVKNKEFQALSNEIDLKIKEKFAYANAQSQSLYYSKRLEHIGEQIKNAKINRQYTESRINAQNEEDKIQEFSKSIKTAKESRSLANLQATGELSAITKPGKWRDYTEQHENIDAISILNDVKEKTDKGEELTGEYKDLFIDKEDLKKELERFDKSEGGKLYKSLLENSAFLITTVNNGITLKEFDSKMAKMRELSGQNGLEDIAIKKLLYAIVDGKSTDPDLETLDITLQKFLELPRYLQAHILVQLETGGKADVPVDMPSQNNPSQKKVLFHQ